MWTHNFPPWRFRLELSQALDVCMGSRSPSLVKGRLCLVKGKKLNKKGLGGAPSCGFNWFPQARASKTESFYEVRDFLEEVHTGLDEFLQTLALRHDGFFSQSGCGRVAVGVGRHFCNG